jgi:putative acetyltransferase
VIRATAKADVEAIVELCKRSMAATYGHIFDDDQLRPWLAGPETLNYVSNAIGNTWVFETGEAIAGVLVVADDLIELLWIDEGARGRGIGKQLMAHAESLIAGHEQGRLECFEQNLNAIEFYEHLGWEITRGFDDPLSGARKVEMRKPLG